MSKYTYTKTNRMLAVLLVAMLFIAGSSVAMASEKPQSSGSSTNTVYTPEHQYEIRVNWSGFPLIDYLGSELIETLPKKREPGTGLDHLYRNRYLGKYTTAIISTELLMNLARKFSLGISFGCDSFWKDYYDPLSNSKIRKTSVIFIAMATAYGNWYQSDILRVYSGASLGIHVGFNIQSNVIFYPSAQLIPVGLTVGKRVYGLVELSSGLSWIGGRIGIGYKF